MATKNIVPNSDGEGQLGTSSKSWAQGHIDSITGTIATAAQGSITSLGTLTALSISGDLTVSGGDITLGAAATAGTLSLVASAHGAVGNSLTISGGSTTAGTTDNIAGGSLILTGGAGKGTGDGGSVIIKSATKGSSGSSLNAIDDTIATFASDLSTTFAGGIAVAGASSLPVSNSKNSAGIQIPTNKQLGFGNGASSKPDFGFAVDGTSGDAKLEIFCGTGGDGVDAFFDTNGFFNAAALKVADSGTIGTTSTANAMTIASNGDTTFVGDIAVSGGVVTLGNAANASINPLAASSGAGKALTVAGGNAQSGGTDLNAGGLFLLSGNSTGSGTGVIEFYTAPSAGSSGSGSNSSVKRLSIEPDGVLISSKGIEFEGNGLASGQSGISSSTNGGEIRIYTNGNQAFTFGASGAGGDLVVENGDIAFSAAGKGICLGVTSKVASNTLDDYEEGTWTPVMDVSSGSAIGYSVQLGRYTKIGDMVYASFSLNVNSGQANQNSNLSGLPFTSLNVTNVKHAGSFCEVDTNFCNSAIAIATIDANASLIQLRKSGGTNNEPSDLFTANQTGEIIGNIVYKAG